MTSKNKWSSLSRKNLRDVTIGLSLVAASFCPISSSEIWVGFGLLSIGCFIHFISKGVLIRNVVLCDKGIYGIVRHPYYLSSFLVDFSFTLLSGNIFLLVIYPFLFFWAYGPTMRAEEQLLFSRHGDTFLKDSMEIPLVFPDRVSFRNIGSIFQGFSVKRITLKECSRIMRFGATGFSLLLIHDMAGFGFAGFWRHFLPTRDGYADFLFITLTLSLYAASIVTLKIAQRSKAMTPPVMSNLTTP